MSEEYDEEVLADYDEAEEAQAEDVTLDGIAIEKAKAVAGTGFDEFVLRPPLARAIEDAGFEAPSEVQQEAIPQAIFGSHILCQAKSGMGKTAVFVLALLHQIEVADAATNDSVKAVVLANTRELAHQIAAEFERFSVHLPEVTTMAFYGGMPRAKDTQRLAAKTPAIVVGTPGRILDLCRSGDLDLSNVEHFVLDEADKLLEEPKIRTDVQDIYTKITGEKQVMMFSATLSPEVREVARLFMKFPVEITIDDETQLSLRGLQHFSKELAEDQKNPFLVDVLDHLEFSQVVIFVKNIRRASALADLLNECQFPTVFVHSRLSQRRRLEVYNELKSQKARILVSTDLFGRGIDIDSVDLVINYDVPSDFYQYLHRVGRAGRFGTKGLAISFVAGEEDKTLMEEVRSRFEVTVNPVPENLDELSI